MLMLGMTFMNGVPITGMIIVTGAVGMAALLAYRHGGDYTHRGKHAFIRWVGRGAKKGIVTGAKWTWGAMKASKKSAAKEIKRLRKQRREAKKHHDPLLAHSIDAEVEAVKAEEGLIDLQQGVELEQMGEAEESAVSSAIAHEDHEMLQQEYQQNLEEKKGIERFFYLTQQLEHLLQQQPQDPQARAQLLEQAETILGHLAETAIAMGHTCEEHDQTIRHHVKHLREAMRDQVEHSKRTWHLQQGVHRAYESTKKRIEHALTGAEHAIKEHAHSLQAIDSSPVDMGSMKQEIGRALALMKKTRSVLHGRLQYLEHLIQMYRSEAKATLDAGHRLAQEEHEFNENFRASEQTAHEIAAKSHEISVMLRAEEHDLEHAEQGQPVRIGAHQRDAFGMDVHELLNALEQWLELNLQHYVIMGRSTGILIEIHRLAEASNRVTAAFANIIEQDMELMNTLIETSASTGGVSQQADAATNQHQQTLIQGEQHVRDRMENIENHLWHSDKQTDAELRQVYGDEQHLHAQAQEILAEFRQRKEWCINVVKGSLAGILSLSVAVSGKQLDRIERQLEDSQKNVGIQMARAQSANRAAVAAERSHHIETLAA